jgi:hypothetical protein
VTKVVAFHELAHDTPLPPGQAVRVFEFPAEIGTGLHALRVSLQGACYIRTQRQSSVGCTLRITVGQRSIVTVPTTTLLPTPGGETPASAAMGIVRFNDLPEGTAIQAGAMLFRSDVMVGYVATDRADAEDGSLSVQVRAAVPGAAGNCPEEMSFRWIPDPGEPTQGYDGYALPPGMTGGADTGASASQFMLKVGSGQFLADIAQGTPQFIIRVDMIDEAIRSGDLAAVPWVLCGTVFTADIGADRWAWRCVVEDLEALKE